MICKYFNCRVCFAKLKVSALAEYKRLINLLPKVSSNLFFIQSDDKWYGSDDQWNYIFRTEKKLLMKSKLLSWDVWRAETWTNDTWFKFFFVINRTHISIKEPMCLNYIVRKYHSKVIILSFEPISKFIVLTVTDQVVIHFMVSHVVIV